MIYKLKKNINVVLDILEKYDPYDLAKLCGVQEYEIEAIEIASRASVMDKKELAKWCEEVFTYWLYNINNKKMWMDIAGEIKDKLEV